MKGFLAGSKENQEKNGRKYQPRESGNQKIQPVCDRPAQWAERAGKKREPAVQEREKSEWIVSAKVKFPKFQQRSQAHPRESGGRRKAMN